MASVQVTGLAKCGSIRNALNPAHLFQTSPDWCNCLLLHFVLAEISAVILSLVSCVSGTLALFLPLSGQQRGVWSEEGGRESKEKTDKRVGQVWGKDP